MRKGGSAGASAGPPIPASASHRMTLSAIGLPGLEDFSSHASTSAIR